MYFSQQTIIGFLGATPEIKHLPNGTPVLRITVATKKSWKDPQTEEWKDRTQWHHVVAYGEHFVRMAARLTTGAHVLVQGEMLTRMYDKTIEVSNGQQLIPHTIKALLVELKAETIRFLDHGGSDPALCANMIETSSHPAITDSQRAEKDMREHGCYNEAQWRSTKGRVSRAGAEGRRAERALPERSAC